MKTKFRRNTPEEEAAIQRGINADPDNPEWTAEDFAQAIPFKEIKQRGRPKSERPKVSITLRLDGEIVDFFRARGDGWQTRLNALLAAHVKRASRRVAK